MKNINLPAFGGIVSCKSFSKFEKARKFENLFRNEYCELYVNKESHNSRITNFLISKNRFVWTGGFSSNIDLKNFDPSENDEKFILIDFGKKFINIYTDHYSRIPLFFSLDNDVLYFSSSLKMLQKLRPYQSFKVDYKGLLFYYNFGFSNYNNYLEKSIESLSAGVHLSFDLEKNALTKTNYHNSYTKNTMNKAINNSLNKNIRLVDNALLEGTKKTLNHFNKIGIAMSGGVDSGYLAQKINECGRSFSSYSIGYKDGYNEFERIDQLSKALDFKTKKIIIDETDIINNFLEVSEQSSYPIYFNNSILNFVYKEANKDNVDVIFDGDGADRMFLGSNSFIRLNKVLNFYRLSKKLSLNTLIPFIFKKINNSTIKNIRFYFERFNHGYPFYGLRQLSDFNKYDKIFENILHEITLPSEIPEDMKSDHWKYFVMFSLYYFSAQFLHNQYELQIKYNIASNPQFWTDNIVNLALSIPFDQKIYKNTTKHVLREAAKTKIDDSYWNLSKIGLQNSYSFIKTKKTGKDFIRSYIGKIKKTEEYLYLIEHSPNTYIDPERLIPYYIWKENLVK